MSIVDFIGYLAPVCLVVSFLFKNVTKLRIVNSVGSLLFVTYGLLIGAYPVVVANAIIVGINIYHLLFEKKKFGI